MHDRHLDAAMTGGAECYKVGHFVCNVGDQEIAAAVDVVNVKSAAVRAPLSAAQPAGFISVDDFAPNALPSPTVLEVAASAIIRMIWPHHFLFSAFVGAVFSPARHFTRKRPKRLIAVAARQRFRRHQRFVATRFRAALLARAFSKLIPAYNADGHSRACLQKGMVTCFGTKTALYRLLSDMVRALKSRVAMSADIGRALNHRCAVARLRAENSRAVVGLELFQTLGARLEHR